MRVYSAMRNGLILIWLTILIWVIFFVYILAADFEPPNRMHPRGGGPPPAQVYNRPGTYVYSPPITVPYVPPPPRNQLGPIG